MENLKRKRTDAVIEDEIYRACITRYLLSLWSHACMIANLTWRVKISLFSRFASQHYAYTHFRWRNIVWTRNKNKTEENYCIFFYRFSYRPFACQPANKSWNIADSHSHSRLSGGWCVLALLDMREFQSSKFKSRRAKKMCRQSRPIRSNVIFLTR